MGVIFSGLLGIYLWTMVIWYVTRKSRRRIVGTRQVSKFKPVLPPETRQMLTTKALPSESGVHGLRLACLGPFCSSHVLNSVRRLDL